MVPRTLVLQVRLGYPTHFMKYPNHTCIYPTSFLNYPKYILSYPKQLPNYPTRILNYTKLPGAAGVGGTPHGGGGGDHQGRDHLARHVRDPDSLRWGCTRWIQLAR
jgi:hypothetical protein